MQDIPEKQATQYPTRYEAFDHPGILWTNTVLQGEPGGGFEFAAYYEPMQNIGYPHITDGIYASIVSYQGIDFLLDCSSTRPSISRQQFNRSRRYRSYATAKQALLAYIIQARVFCKQGVI